MGLDVISDILTRYKVDTSEMEAGLARIKGKQDELLQKELEAAEKRNSALEGWIDKVGKVGLALEGLHKIVEIGREGWEQYADQVKNTAASAGADIERLTQASHGLRTEDELRAFAAKAMHGAGKLNNEQMADALEAMRALTKQGFDSQEAYDAITNAVVGLRTKGLEKLGITIGETHSRAEKFDAIMAAIHAKADEGRGIVEDEAEGVNKLGVEFKNATDQIKESIGRMVVSLTPLIEALTQIAKVVGKITDGIGDLVDFAQSSYASPFVGGAAGLLKGSKGERRLNRKYGMGTTQSGDAYNADPFAAAHDATGTNNEAQFWAERFLFGGVTQSRNNTTKAQLEAGEADLVNAGQAIKRFFEGGAKDFDHLSDELEKVGLERIRKAREAAEAEAKRIAEVYEKLAAKTLETEAKRREELDKLYGAGRFTGKGAPGVLASDEYYEQALGKRTLSVPGAAAQMDDLGKLLEGMDALKGIRQQGNALEHQSFLETLFGKVEDFKLYEKAFDTLAKAAGESLAAIIDGASSTGFQKQVAAGLHALEVEALVNALKWGATAAGFAVFGDIPQATQAAETAGLWAAAGVAAGLGARELGYGSGGGSPSAGRGAGGGGGGYVNGTGGGNGGGGTTIIVYGDPGASDSPRMAQIKARRTVALAMGSQGGINS